MKRKNGGGGEFIHRRRKGVGVGKGELFSRASSSLRSFRTLKKEKWLWTGCSNLQSTALCSFSLSWLSWIAGLNEYTGLEFRERGGHLF